MINDDTNLHLPKADDPEYTRRKVKEFLATHTAYELIPESGKVVLLDSALPIRQAFHALHEQVGKMFSCSYYILRKPFFSQQRCTSGLSRSPSAAPFSCRTSTWGPSCCFRIGAANACCGLALCQFAHLHPHAPSVQSEEGGAAAVSNPPSARRLQPVCPFAAQRIAADVCTT